MKRLIFKINCFYLFIFFIFSSCSNGKEEISYKKIEKINNIIDKNEPLMDTKLLSLFDINKIKIKDKNNIFLYVLLYIKYYGYYDLKLNSLLKIAILDKKNIYNTEALDLYIRENIKNWNIKTIINLLKNIDYSNLYYADIINKLIKKDSKIDLFIINGDEDFLNLIFYLIENDNSFLNDYYNQINSYIISFYDKKEKKFKIDFSNYYSKIIMSKLDYLHLISKIYNKLNFNYEDLYVLKNNNIKSEEIIFIYDLIKNNYGLKSEQTIKFNNFLSNYKNYNKYFLYSWVIINRSIYGYSGVKNEIEQLLKNFEKSSKEWYILKSYQTYGNYSLDYNTLNNIFELIDFHPNEYFTYNLLEKFLTNMLEKNDKILNNNFKDKLLKINISKLKSIYASNISHILNLIYPDNTQIKQYVEENIPLSYSNFKQGNTDISKYLYTNNKKNKTQKNKNKFYLMIKLLDNTKINKMKKIYKEENLLTFLDTLKSIHIENENYYDSLNTKREYVTLKYGDFLKKFELEDLYDLYPTPYLNIVKNYSNKYNVDIALIYAVMREESNFKKDIISRTNAIGLMQIMPSTGEWLKNIIKVDKYDLYEPKDNINLGVFYLSMLFNELKDINYVLAAYNAGKSRIIRWHNHYKNYKYDELLELIPFDETRNYIRKVIQSYHIYKYILNNH